MKNRLKELRGLHQRSQAAVAKELGVSRQAVNGFESGKFDPSLEMAFKIASLFDVAIADVFIYEAKNSMPTIVSRIKDFWGFKFGFERFTDAAIDVFRVAREEAARRGKSQVEPEHILIGLLANPDTTASRLLQVNGAESGIEVGEHSLDDRKKLKFSPQSEFVVELALQIVRLQGKRAIETEHVLWGLVQLSETDKTNLRDQFQGYGVDSRALNNQLVEVV